MDKYSDSSDVYSKIKRSIPAKEAFNYIKNNQLTLNF